MTDFRSLPWFTDLSSAITEARRTNKPILSLRLLGNLPDELTCANSRFFKRVLYPEPRIHQLLRQDFVLHWQSVRPVPLVTLDFGNGRRITKTLTGNSAHLVLDSHGRLVDALPGLFDPDTFLALLAQARTFAHADRRTLPQLHAWAMLGAGGPPAAPPPPSRAMTASMLAMSKHRVELPVLRQVEPLPQTPSGIADDTAKNTELHARIHEAFAHNTEWAGIDGFVEWLYAELFEMPLHDPALGLDVPDPFDDVSYAPGPTTHRTGPSALSTAPRARGTAPHARGTAPSGWIVTPHAHPHSGDSSMGTSSNGTSSNGASWSGASSSGTSSSGAYRTSASSHGATSPDHAQSASSHASTSPRLTTPARANSASSSMPARHPQSASSHASTSPRLTTPARSNSASSSTPARLASATSRSSSPTSR